MSSTIEYEWKPFTITVAGIRRYAIATLIGASNVTVERYDRLGRPREVLDRSWAINFLGTDVQVLKQAIYYAGDCCSGSLCWKHRGNRQTPEQYIARARASLVSAQPIADEGFHFQRMPGSASVPVRPGPPGGSEEEWEAWDRSAACTLPWTVAKPTGLHW